jgi:hypothetical protein
MNSRQVLQVCIALELRKTQLLGEIKSHEGKTDQASADAVAKARIALVDCEAAAEWIVYDYSPSNSGN